MEIKEILIKISPQKKILFLIQMDQPAIIISELKIPLTDQILSTDQMTKVNNFKIHLIKIQEILLDRIHLMKIKIDFLIIDQIFTQIIIDNSMTIEIDKTPLWIILDKACFNKTDKIIIIDSTITEIIEIHLKWKLNIHLDLDKIINSETAE